MGMFSSESEVDRYLGGIFEVAMADPKLSDELAASGVVLRINYSDPDASVTIDLPAKKVYTGACDLVPGVEMFMTADMGNRFWLGKVNLPVAMAKGQVRAKGPVPKVLKLVPVSKQLFPRYEEMLRADSRDDLLNA